MFVNIKNSFFFTFILLAKIVSAEVWTYPNPGDSSLISSSYSVTVFQDNKKHNSFVYFSKSNVNDTTRSASWTTFSFQKKIKIEVDVYGEIVEQCELKPNSKNIDFKSEQNKIVIELDSPQKLTIIINGNKKHPLFIFADGPEEFIPNKRESGLMYFGPGYHQVENVLVPDSVKHIYIAGGAFVKGTFTNNNKASGFKITGRGILCSTATKEEQQTISLNGNGKNVLIEGITILGGNGQSIIGKQSYTTIRNCKLINWNTNADGISVGAHGLIQNCFFRMNGDVIKLEHNYFTLNNCIFWQNEKGAPFQFGWSGQEDFHSFNIYDCDIIYCEHAEEELNQAIFSSVHGGIANLSEYYFENIRIEGDVYRLFKLTLRFTVKDKDPGYGSISKITFKNITLQGNCLMANEIWGYSKEHRIGNVVFDKVRINGKHIKSAQEGNFKINLNTTSDIVFK